MKHLLGGRLTDRRCLTGNEVIVRPARLQRRTALAGIAMFFTGAASRVSVPSAPRSVAAARSAAPSRPGEEHADPPVTSNTSAPRTAASLSKL